MECGDAESEPEKQNDDSPEKEKILQNCIKENGNSDSIDDINLKIPLTVLDDSGIGSSLSQLKEDAGLPTKSCKSNHSGNDDGQSFQKLRDNVNFQRREASNHVNARESGREPTSGEETERKYLKDSSPENLFETPPNSLLCNIPVSVLEAAADSLKSTVELKQDDATATESNSSINLEDENTSDSTLVTSASQNGSEIMPNEDANWEENGSNQPTCQGNHVSNSDKAGQRCDNKLDKMSPECSSKMCLKFDRNERYNPTIPVEQWSPIKVRNNRDTIHSTENEDCYNEGRGLPPDQWTPTKCHKQQVTENDSMIINRTQPIDRGSPARTFVKGSQATVTRRSSDRKKYTFEEIIQMTEEKIQNLLTKTDFCVAETRSDLKFIQRQTRYSSDVILNRRIVDRIVQMGIAHVFLKVWQSVTNVDCLQPQNLIAFKNLQATLSIIWNCTDKSSALCESLVRCGVVQLLITELAGDRLRKGDMSNENTLYLLKAYLGILHNMARLCTDSRKLFRSSNAVEILKTYLGSEHGLIKTKAYLILSYIITEGENDIINATHDHLNYIIGILREALSSENHYAKTTAFWANEIADGLNHLAVNDANKIRMGQLGVIQLYLKLLQSDSVEEQSLGTAGLWILAFCDENKYLINKVHGCMEALYSIANNSPHESIRRSAHGAIWVIKKTPERPTIKQVKDTDIPHVMISYQWTAQHTMVKVRNRLKAAGYKVWMDVDNMSGSTLEAMALAVERAAVVLVCMSQVYKDSASCRTEAEYTYSQRKDIIPLLLQQGYVPDGWLGALVGTRIYFDLTDEQALNNQIDRLIIEIGSRGRMNATSRALCASGDYERPSGSSMCSDLSLSSSTSSLHSYMRLPAAQSWGQAEVKQWLTSHQLRHVADRFEGFTGDLLIQYKSMMKTAPEFFYSSLETKLNLDLVSSLRFAKALNGLAANA